jgi:hypothetical protein
LFVFRTGRGLADADIRRQFLPFGAARIAAIVQPINARRCKWSGPARQVSPTERPADDA